MSYTRTCDLFSKQGSGNHQNKSTKHFPKPDFLVKLWFSKTRVSSPAAPRGGLYFQKMTPPPKKENPEQKENKQLVKHIYFAHWIAVTAIPIC